MVLNTAITQKKFSKYRNTATPQYRVETRCNPEISTLHAKLSANNIEIKLGSFRFRQNKQNVTSIDVLALTKSNLPFANCYTRNCSESSVSLERISTILENRES